MKDNNNHQDLLWLKAKRRVGFKRHFTIYVIINAFLWISWFLTKEQNEYFWPIWTTIGWGIGIMFHYLSAYGKTKFYSVEKEYEKLINKKDN